MIMPGLLFRYGFVIEAIAKATDHWAATVTGRQSRYGRAFSMSRLYFVLYSYSKTIPEKQQVNIMWLPPGGTFGLATGFVSGLRRWHPALIERSGTAFLIFVG
jgi:hypothetical protein